MFPFYMFVRIPYVISVIITVLFTVVCSWPALSLLTGKLTEHGTFDTTCLLIRVIVFTYLCIQKKALTDAYESNAEKHNHCQTYTSFELRICVLEYLNKKTIAYKFSRGIYICSFWNVVYCVTSRIPIVIFGHCYFLFKLLIVENMSIIITSI